LSPIECRQNASLSDDEDSSISLFRGRVCLNVSQSPLSLIASMEFGDIACLLCIFLLWILLSSVILEKLLYVHLQIHSEHH
jgi:hypothetical protein